MAFSLVVPWKILKHLVQQPVVDVHLIVIVLLVVKFVLEASSWLRIFVVFLLFLVATKVFSIFLQNRILKGDGSCTLMMITMTRRLNLIMTTILTLIKSMHK